MKKKNLLFTTMAMLTLSTPMFAQNVPSYVPTNGLAGWWPFTGNAGDSSSNLNDGTVNGAVLSNDRNGNANSSYFFDGIDDNISMASMNNIPIGNSARTISAWMNPASLAATWTYTGVSYGSASNNNAFMLGLGNNLIVIQGWSNDYSTALTYNTGEWLHVICTFDGLNVQIYVNGSLLGSGSLSNINTTGSDFFFGARPSLGNSFFHGGLDDIGIWNRVLTECEISDLYNSQLGSLNTSATQTQTALDSYTWPINSQTYTQSGNYTAIIPNAAGCDSTITLDLSLDFTGIYEFSEDNLFTVFPNPAQSVININVDSRLVGSTYFIYDNSGKSVLTGIINSENSTIQLSQLSSGIYLFSIGKNLQQQFKLIKE